MRAFPNMTVVQPCDAISAKALAAKSVDFKGPLYIRLHRNPVDNIYDDSYEFEFGKGRIVIEYGKELTMIVSGIMMQKALKAAALLKEHGYGVRIIDMATIKPLDEGLIVHSAYETGAIMTIEDHSIKGGLGSAVAEVIVQNNPVPMKLVGIQDRFGESGDPELLYRDNAMDIDSLVEQSIELIRRKKQ